MFMSRFRGRFKVVVSDPLLLLFAVVSISRTPALANIATDPTEEGSIDVLLPKKRRRGLSL